MEENVNKRRNVLAVALAFLNVLERVHMKKAKIAHLIKQIMIPTAPLY